MTQTPEGWNTNWQPGEPDLLTPPPPPPAPPTPWYRRRRLQVLAGAVTALVALAIVLPLTLTGGPTEVPMTIVLALIDSDGGNCSDGGNGGYGDIEPGMPVTVEDESHKVLASSSLPSHGYDGDGSVDMGCVWKMVVKVPADRQQYGVTAGSRGTVTFDRTQLIRDKWEASLSIGEGAN